MRPLTRRQRAAIALLFVVALFLFSALFLRFPLIYDTDSYFHLAVARLYAHEGLVNHLDWARMSLMKSSFGDKEILFHLFLVPFTASDPATGGRLALALINASIATVIAVIAVRCIGWSGLLVPLWLWIAAPALASRLVRLRPELFALLFFLLAMMFAARRRYVLLFVAAALFALSYTAFHVFLLVAVLWFAALALLTGERDWKLAGTMSGGTVAGLLVHPYFPSNLRTWFVQNVEFFRLKGLLDVGGEIDAPQWSSLLSQNVAFVLGIVVLAAVLYRDSGGKQEDQKRDEQQQRFVIFSSMLAVLFFVLFLFIARMSTYFVPFLAIALLAAFSGTARREPRWIALLLTGCVVLGLPFAANPTVRQLLRGGRDSEHEWARFGAAVPPGAKVATDWQNAELYCFWAPQGRYLDVLDPVFMALPHPREYADLRAIFDGADPDVASSIGRRLDSDFVAFDRTGVPPVLASRVVNDPRFAIRYGGYQLLAQRVPGRNSAFVTTWRVAPLTDVDPATPEPPQVPEAMLLPVTFADSSPGFEAFVSRRSAAALFVHHETNEAAKDVAYEFAPYGAASMWIDGRLVARTPPRGAVLGSGIPLRVRFSPGIHEVIVMESGGEQGGFYLLDRSVRMSANALR